jgi:hypothetical protein
MATVAAPALPVRAVARGDRFFVRMAAVCLAVAVIGFLPSYWTPMFRGTLDVTPLAHVHAVLFFGWMAFFVGQAWLVADGRLVRHREMGVAGVALATAMVLVGLAMAIHSMKLREAAGQGDAARAFASVPVTGILMFAALVAAALMNTRKPAVHKRLLLVASVSLLQAGAGRWFAYFLAPPRPAGAVGPAPQPPVAVTVMPGLLIDLLIVAGMIHDRRTRGRVHPVYWAAGGAVLALQVLRVPLSTTQSWDHVARWLLALSP